MRPFVLGVAFVLTTAASSLLVAQTAPLASTTHLLDVDSGYVENASITPAALGMPACVWSTVVKVTGASWLRLSYSGVLLSGAREPGRDGSYLKITSVQDGQFQTQHLIHVEQWQETSAYFNGDAVVLEIWAQPGTGQSRLVLGPVTAGPLATGPVGVDSICGSTDDRVLSSDNRAGRLEPVGCTAWIINDCQHCLLTAGHCSGTGAQVVEFNVPLSSTSGSAQHPGPQDQYSVDPASMQSSGGGGIGNDWAYFGVFPNSTTNLTPYAAYGGLAFDLLPSPPPVGSQLIRVTGYGTTSSPVPASWNVAQKTHAGPYVSASGSTIEYQTDTTGGNSGSPAFLDGTNQAIGIHTHGGCSGSGGNSGTASSQNGLRSALGDPQGVCVCPTLEFSYPNGLPTAVQPDGSTTIRVAIGGALTLQPGSVRFHVSTGGAFQTLTPVAVANGEFDATVPASPCLSSLQFYFSAQATTATTYTDPAAAPTSVYSARSAAAAVSVRNYNFNTTPPGWLVSGSNLTAGPWERGALNDPYGPQVDFDGSGQCWVTGLANGVNVNGGPTILTSEVLDLSGTTDANVYYALWFDSDPGDDDLIVEASENGGQSWVTLETLPPFSGWELHGFRVLDHFTNLSQIVVRFVVADEPNNSTCEAAVDAFRVEDLACAPATWTTFGSGCPGQGGVPTLSALTMPETGTTFMLYASNLGGGVAFMVTGFGTVNLPLQPYGFGSGCSLLATTDWVAFLVQSGGGALWSMQLPNTPVLAYMHIYNQLVEVGSSMAVSAGGDAEIH